MSIFPKSVGLLVVFFWGTASAQTVQLISPEAQSADEVTQWAPILDQPDPSSQTLGYLGADDVAQYEGEAFGWNRVTLKDGVQGYCRKDKCLKSGEPNRPEAGSTLIAGAVLGRTFQIPSTGSQSLRSIYAGTGDNGLLRLTFESIDSDGRYRRLPEQQTKSASQLKTFARAQTALPSIAEEDIRFQDQTLYNLSDHGEITGVVGTHDGTRILSIKFVGLKDRTEIFPDTPELNSGKTFSLWIPEHARFAGIIGSHDNNGLTSIGLDYEFPAIRDDQAFAAAASMQLWKERDAQIPVKSDSFDSPRHGNYTTSDVFRFKYLSSQGILRLHRHSGEKRTLESWDFFVGLSDIYPQRDGPGRLIAGHQNLRIVDAPGLPKSLDLTPVEDYPAPSEDKISWGGTFSLEQHPTQVLANFRGYNIHRIDPRDLETYTGASHLIFSPPGEDSFDYLPTNGHIIVPHGLIFRPDNLGTERGKTTTVKTSEDYTDSWGANVGANAGVEGLGKFSMNSSFSTEREQVHQNETTRAVTTTSSTKYGLVLDRPRIKLHPTFYDRVHQLRDDLDLYGAEGPDYDQFIEAFGTHYTYAVTYGGMAYAESDHRSNTEELRKKTEFSVEASADASIFGIDAGASAGYDQSNESDESTTQESTLVRFNTYGGSESKGEGWSLSRGEEVPLYLDLRPVWDLFSPIYFDDPVIWTTLRSGMRREVSNWGEWASPLEEKLRSHRDVYWSTSKSIRSREASPNDRFGASLDPDIHDQLIVGIPGKKRAEIYEYRDSGYSNLSFNSVLASPSSSGSTDFGRAVAIDDNIAVVAARGDAHIFKRGKNGWVWIQSLKTRSDMSNNYGSAVALSGHVAAVSDIKNNAVYIFQQKSLDNWKLIAELRSEKESFGYAIDIEGNSVAVGTPQDGSVSLYHRHSGGDENWGQAATWAENGQRGAGSALSLTRTHLIVGAPGFEPGEDNNTKTGKVTVLRIANEDGKRDFDDDGELVIREQESFSGDPGFGYDVHAYGDEFIVSQHNPNSTSSNSSSKAAFLYEYELDDDIWTFAEDFSRSMFEEGPMASRSNVALSSGFAVIGAGKHESREYGLVYLSFARDTDQ